SLRIVSWLTAKLISKALLAASLRVKPTGTIIDSFVLTMVPETFPAEIRTGLFCWSSKFSNSVSLQAIIAQSARRRSEEHTSELQSRENLVCRLLLEKKKTQENNETQYDSQPLSRARLVRLTAGVDIVHGG